MSKPYISPSQMGMLTRCGEQYRRRYLEKEIIPPGIRMLVGSGTHAGAEKNFIQKIESHEDLPEADIVEAAVEGFKAKVNVEGVIFTTEETSKGQDRVLGDATDEVATLAGYHAELQAPEYQPVAVEVKTRIVLPSAPRDLLGITDMRDDKGRVVDFKTVGRKKPQSEADNSVQLTVYAAAYAVDNDGELPSEVRLDVLTTTKTPARQVLSSSRTSDDMQNLVNRINASVAVIEAGVFLPANPDDWCCSPRWCGYWHTCPYVNQERLLKAEGKN